jgi:hypothetical protein
VGANIGRLAHATPEQVHQAARDAPAENLSCAARGLRDHHWRKWMKLSGKAAALKIVALLRTLL